MQQPLLNKNEIIDVLLRIKNKNIKYRTAHDSAFKQMGELRSVFRGSGMDYEESRHYQPGDDPRYMNWALTARTDQHYMKVFRQERQPGVFILIDRRNSMLFGTQQRLKATQAVRVAATAAFTAQEKNYSIGGVILDDEVEWYKENQNKQAAYDFINRAARPALPIFYKKQRQGIKINTILTILNEILTKGSTIFIISDFYDLSENSQPILLQLSASHNVNAIQITDPAELTLPKAGVTLLKSELSSKPVNINTQSAKQQQSYKNSSDKYFNDKRRIFENIAIPFQQVLTTDEAVEQKVLF